MTNQIRQAGVCVTAMLAILAVGLLSVAGDLKQPMIGETAPGFALKRLDGKVMTLEQQRGRFVVLHFAASW